MNEATLESQIACNDFSHHRYSVYITVLTMVQLIWPVTTVPILKKLCIKILSILVSMLNTPRLVLFRGKKGGGRTQAACTLLSQGKGLVPDVH